MVHTCVAYGCTEKFVKGGPLTFHRFPKDENMRKLWEIKIRRQDFKPNDSSTICSKHFTADCFDENKLGGTWLKKNAVPTIFDFSAEQNIRTSKKKIKVEENTDIHCGESTAREEVEKGTKLKKEGNIDIQSESTAREDVENGTKLKKEGSIDIQSAPSVVENKECGGRSFRYMGDFKESDMNSPVIALKFYKLANSVMKKKCVKVKALVRSNNRLQKKVASLKNILGDRKKRKSLATDALQEIVMETPSPQIVGREFVRQYYALLCKAPLHLYRFYKDDSVFLHQGLDRCELDTRPVVGQQDIQESMKQLGFHNCRVKIIRIDCLDTVGNGLIVLVTGELSNNSGPMQRFTQTFVLVLQAPKKYYVRNNIFRYQDEILSEDDNESKTYLMVSKNTRSNSAFRSIPASSNTTSPVSYLPSAHKIEQTSVFKTKGTPVSAGQANKDKNEEIILPDVSADDSCSIDSGSEKDF